MRLFVALDIDDSIRDRITRVLDEVSGFAPEARWARPESLHVTLKFIGEQSGAQVDEIKCSLATMESDQFQMNFRGYGFFPSARAPRVFWIGIESGPELASLASSVDSKLASLNIQKEKHAYNPHLTLARISGRSASTHSASLHKEKGDGPNRSFWPLQEKLEALPVPEFGTMTAREFFLYQSKPSPGGSQYTKLARFALG